MDAKPVKRKQWTKFLPLYPLAMTFPPLINSFDNPHLKGLRGPDVLQLVAIGIGIGAAIALFFAGLHERRDSS